MASRHIVSLLVGGLLIFCGDASAETQDCRTQLKRQDQQCQALAEKLAEVCPSGTNIKETPECRAVSSEIASTCTRKPCAPPPRKGKRTKSKGMGGSKPAKKAASPSQ